jgi:hypothetical protein
MSGVRRLVVSGVALTALLALVAVASRAHRPGGGSGAGAAHPPRILFEYLASVMIILLPIGAAVIIWMLAQSRREAVLAGQRNWRRSLALLLALAPVLIASFFVVRHLRPPPTKPQSIAKLPRTTVTTRKGKSHREPIRHVQPAHFQWLAVVVLGSLVLGIAITTGVSLAWKRRQGEAWAEEAALAAALDEVLADTLDDLRAERDPRRAVIRTYARMERTFAAYGVPRDEAEAPLEYVARVLDRLSVSSFAVSRVTQLFSRAKFSPHEIDAGMKEEAIDALAGLRAELEHKEGERAA